jgi:hypothetical protein
MTVTIGDAVDALATMRLAAAFKLSLSQQKQRLRGLPRSLVTV